MLSIIWMVFVAAFLGAFGLDTLFIEGFKQLFGLEIGITSYYLIFALAGLVKNILKANANVSVSLDELKDKYKIKNKK